MTHRTEKKFGSPNRISIIQELENFVVGVEKDTCKRLAQLFLIISTEFSRMFGRMFTAAITEIYRFSPSSFTSVSLTETEIFFSCDTLHGERTQFLEFPLSRNQREKIPP